MASLGRQIGVEGNTIARWEQGKFVPTFAVRAPLLAVLAPAPVELLDVLRRELDIPAPPPDAPLVAARTALDSSMLAMSEVLGPIATPTLRAATAALLLRMRELGLDVAQACAVIERGRS